MADDEQHINDLAERFTAVCVRKWVERGLAPAALGSAFVAWGLAAASAESTPAEVAEGLQRIADVIMDGEPSPPRHLI